MNRNEVFQKVVEICKDIFDEETLEITEKTSPADISEWDSLAQLSLVNEIEEAFDVAFDLDDVSAGKSIGEIIDAVMKYIEKQ